MTKSFLSTPSARSQLWNNNGVFETEETTVDLGVSTELRMVVYVEMLIPLVCKTFDSFLRETEVTRGKVLFCIV